MKIISKANETALAILRKPKTAEGAFRLMHFCTEVPVDGGVLLFHQLTRELVLLTEAEYANCLDDPYLREHWFVVPEGTNDKGCAQLVKLVLQNRRRKSKYTTDYTIFPTTDCNARCFYCYELGRSRIPMSGETARKVVRYIKDHCGGEKVRITWFGGEPLYNQEAIDIICDGLHREGIPFATRMISNGYLFDEAVVKKAVEQWHLKQIQISLDGTETVYNRIKAYIYETGNPYRIVLNNMERLLDASVEVAVRLNMDLHNAEDLLELTEELAGRFGGRENFSVYAHHLFEKNESMADTHTQEQWRQRGEAMDRIERKCEQSGLLSRKGIARQMKLYHCMADCGHAVTILPDGNIGLCEHFSESEFIGHIDREGFDAEVVASWKETVPEIDECATCFYYPDCIMLKKCSNANKCFPQYREGLRRRTRREMVCEYENWLKRQ